MFSFYTSETQDPEKRNDFHEASVTCIWHLAFIFFFFFFFFNEDLESDAYVLID